MTPFEKLAIKIKKDLDVTLYNFQRTRIGWHGRSAGGFTWTAQSNQSPMDYGSCSTVKDLLKGEGLDIYSNGFGYEIHIKGE